MHISLFVVYQYKVYGCILCISFIEGLLTYLFLKCNAYMKITNIMEDKSI